MRHLIVILLLFSGSFQAAGQQPSYFFFGEDALEGLDIYSIVQDLEYNYWIATDQGLFKHDGYAFSKMSCKGINSVSVFDLQISPDGTIYCVNLNHQVFRIKGGVCEFIFTIPDHGNDISISILNEKELIVNSSKNLYRISESGQLLSRTYIEKSYVSTVRGPANHAPLFQAGPNLVHFTDGKFVTQPLSLNGEPLPIKHVNSFRWFTLNQTIYALDAWTAEVYRLNDREDEVVQVKGFQREFFSKSVRFYSVSDELWVTDNRLGIQRVRKEDQFSSLPERIFPDIFISVIYEDTEGNQLLGTFDRGIIVVPDIDIPDALPILAPYRVTRLTSTSNGSVYAGTQSGHVLALGDELAFLTEEGNKYIESLLPINDSILITDNDGFEIINLITGHSIKNGIGSVKDALPYHGRYICAFNTGLLALEMKDEELQVERLFSGRTYGLCREAGSDHFYASSYAGVIYGNPQEGFKELSFKNNPVRAICLESFGKETFISTRNDGILVFRNGQLQRHFQIAFHNEHLTALKIMAYGDKIVANTDRGLLLTNKNGVIELFIDKSTGISTNKVIDFCLSGSDLWVTHRNGVQRLNLDKMRATPNKPLIFLRSVAVNDQLLEKSALTDFPSSDRKFTFEFFSPTLVHRDKIRYHYKLKGADTEWTILPYQDHSVTFNALAPGTYTFLVKAENNGVFSETRSYQFTISAPFYERWWFWLLSALLVIGSIVLIYQRRLRMQQAKSKRINELNASRLTAIRSQMNPHFIFNSLNSIQDLVLKGDVNNSYTSITQFSHLVRRTLNYSDKDLIDFEQEIELLELYLSLEQLRFKDALHYTIKTEGIDDIMIPPMLIQPFIENALIHGLLHKEGEKKLEIRFDLFNGQLRCSIRDNGIGRKKAREIQTRQGKEHQSFATNAIKRRFELLQKHFDHTPGFHYEDSDTGTVVHILLPYKNKF